MKQDCVDYFKPRNVGTILDVGCGTGDWALFLARQGFLVSGYDPSEDAVREARARADRDRIAAEFEVGPIHQPPYVEVFDAAVAALSLDRLSRSEMAITVDAIHERVRRGGLIYVLFHPHPTSIYKDNELRALFHGFRLHEFRSYPEGFRGLLWKRD